MKDIKMANSTLKAINEISRDGLMRGIVVSNKDEMLEGRVALMVPKMINKYDPKKISAITIKESVSTSNMRNEEMTDLVPSEVSTSNHIWFRPVFNNDFIVPYVGQVVYCFFEDGDPQKPYYYPQECSLNGEVIPMEKLKHSKDKFDADRKHKIHTIFEFHDGTIMYQNENKDHKRLAITFRNNHSISINENPDENSIEIITSSGHVIVCDDLKKNIIIKSSAGHSIILDDPTKNVTVRTISGHTINMDDPSKNVTVKTIGGHSISMDDPSSNIWLKASSGGKIRIGNGTVSINGS